MELSLTLLEPQRRAELFGAGDRHLRRIRDQLGVQIHARNQVLRLVGEPESVAKAAAVIERLQAELRESEYLPDEVVDAAIAQVDRGPAVEAADSISVFTREPVVPRTPGQRHYVQQMLTHDLVVCSGPAGSGKTYLAVAVAVHLLKVGRVKRICLVRPAVEAGERLGFLPGDLQQKVNPYLRPLFDAMHDMMTYEQLRRFTASDVVEVIPLAYMRGRTLNHAVIILDEAQNATPAQTLMFLTRLGLHSKMIVTGDDTQTDLPEGQISGLVDAMRRLADCRGVAIVRLTEGDIVRHRLVQEVVARYAEKPRRRSGAGREA